jgi:hypothetical protein
MFMKSETGYRCIVTTYVRRVKKEKKEKKKKKRSPNLLLDIKKGGFFFRRGTNSVILWVKGGSGFEAAVGFEKEKKSSENLKFTVVIAIFLSFLCFSSLFLLGENCFCTECMMGARFDWRKGEVGV